MNRTTAAALVTTAVIGLSAGAVTAVVRGDVPGARPTAGDSPRAKPDPEPGAGSLQVLYAVPGKIVDGDEVVSWKARFGQVGQVARVDGGWLVTEPTYQGSTEPARDVVLVRKDGSTRVLASVTDRFVVHPDGDRFAGLGKGGIAVWDLQGKALATSTWGRRGWKTATWVDDRLLISFTGDAYSTDTAIFDPATGRTEELPLAMRQVEASPDGRLIVGRVPQGDPQGDSCTGLRPAPEGAAVGDLPGWESCDWRALSFSPDGTRLLAVSRDSDGFGPTGFVAFPAEGGPSKGVTSFTAPDLTLEGTWGDDDRLLVHGASDQDLDEQTEHWLRVCVLETGDCEEIAREKSWITVGEGTR